MNSPSAEFHDLDGSYVLVQPLDEVRCRILASNVALKGEILFKDPELSWTEASADLGGYTRLGASELLPDQEQARVGSVDYRDLLLGEVAQPHDPLLEVEDPSYGKADRSQVYRDLRASLMRLTIHYLESHERSHAGTRRVSVCRCPRYTAQEGNLREARAHAFVSILVLTKKVPSVPRLLRAIRAGSDGRSKVA